MTLFNSFCIITQIYNISHMKTRILLFVAALFGAINFGHASFPVQKAEKKEVIVQSEHVAQVSSSSQSQQQLNMQDTEELVSPAAGGGKSQLVALILVIFVGGLGIHRFYLGYTSIGIIQLLTLGGCGIWALIDLVRIATGDLKPKGGEYSEKL